MKIRKYLFAASFLIVLFQIEYTIAQINNNQIEVKYRKPGVVDVKGFVLNKETTITVEGIGGMFRRYGNNLMFYGWILDGKSRNIVWSLLKDDNDKFFAIHDPDQF